MKTEDNLYDKMVILAASAKYDVSCSSSGSDRQSVKGQLGNAALPGICHSWSEDGRCISLLKILYSNDCVYDCEYCVNRRSNDFPRASFSPNELAKLVINFYRRNYIEGLFLSSAVVKSPDHTMESMIEVVRLLRDVEKFNGYIHMKAIPGSSKALIEMAGKLVDRLSLNLELPTSESLQLLAPQKSRDSILDPMKFVKDSIVHYASDQKTYLKTHDLKFVPAGQTTQMIVGATQDTDYQIARIAQNLYDKMALKRVYYSAYVPIIQNSMILPKEVKTPMLREHRLYQTDWLMRFYGFTYDEILSEKDPNLDMQMDPKAGWALRNYHLFPIEINTADLNTLLRIPGIGPTSARRIIAARKFGNVQRDDLKKMGVVIKRAQFFVICDGRTFLERWITDGSSIRNQLIMTEPIKKISYQSQISFLDTWGNERYFGSGT